MPRLFVVPATVVAGGVAMAGSRMLVGVGRNGRGAGMPGTLRSGVGIVVGVIVGARVLG